LSEAAWIASLVGGGGGIGGALGSTDNAVPRANGTGGTTLQSSGVTINDSDTLHVPGGILMPVTNPTYFSGDFALDDGALRWIKTGGDEVVTVVLAPAGGGEQDYTLLLPETPGTAGQSLIVGSVSGITRNLQFADRVAANDSRLTNERVPTAAGLTTKFGTNKVTLADGDKIALLDSAASDAPKHGLFSLVKSTLKTYFDTLYAAALGSDDNYVTDAEKTVIGNTSGTNTGDNAANSLYSGLVSNATHTGDVTGATTLTIAAGAVTESKCNSSINASLDLADSSIQPGNAALTDARTPTSHTHGGISNAGAIGSTSGLPIKTGASGVLEVGAFGSSAGEFCEGNDSRFKAAYWVEVVLTAAGTAIATGTKVAMLTHMQAGTITGFKIVCDPANEPSAAAVQVDLNSIDLSTGAATSRLSAVASIATSANISTGGTISGTQTVAVGDQSSFDIDQGSDGKELRALVQITPS
jgi:hypothetical protein